MIRTTTTSAEEAAETANNVAQQLKIPDESFEVTTIGPDWGCRRYPIIAYCILCLVVADHPLYCDQIRVQDGN